MTGLSMWFIDDTKKCVSYFYIVYKCEDQIWHVYLFKYLRYIIKSYRVTTYMYVAYMHFMEVIQIHINQQLHQIV